MSESFDEAMMEGRRITEARIDGFGIKLVLDNEFVFEYDASDGGYSDWEIRRLKNDEKEEIDQLPTVNIPTAVGESVGALPVRHGKWCEGTECYSDDFIVCSVCGEAFNVLDNDTYRFDYCPKCGARMDEE